MLGLQILNYYLLGLALNGRGQLDGEQYPSDLKGMYHLYFWVDFHFKTNIKKKMNQN